MNRLAQQLLEERIELEKIRSLLDDIPAMFPDKKGIRIVAFADFVDKAIKGLGLTGGSDRRMNRGGGGVTERTVRYYQTKGWISMPTRYSQRDGREVRYHPIHLIQMVTAYMLRQQRDASLLASVPNMGFQDCVTLLGTKYELSDLEILELVSDVRTSPQYNPWDRGKNRPHGNRKFGPRVTLAIKLEPKVDEAFRALCMERGVSRAEQIKSWIESGA